MILGVMLWGTLGAQSSRQIYIQNHLYTGTVSTVEGVMYIPLTDFLNAMGLDLTMEDGAWKLFPQTEPLTQNQVTQNPCTFIYQDKNFSLFLYYFNNQAYIPLKSMAKYLGAIFSYNPDTNIIDISSINPYSTPISITPTVTPAKTDAAASSVVSASTPTTPVKGALETNPQPTSPYTTSGSKDDPVRVVNFDYYQNDSPIETSQPYTIAQASQLRGVLKIKNYSNQKIENIQTIIHFRDMYGSQDSDIDTMSEPTVTLEAGETKEFDVYWNNNSVVRPNPGVEIIIPDKYKGTSK